MRRCFSLFLALLLLCSLLGGCYAFVPVDIPSDYVPETYPDYTDMEMYQYLHHAVTEESSLEEMIGSFAEMCKIPVETTSEMFLYEVYSYEFEGEHYLNCHIVRQVDEPNSDEYIQLHLDITYLLDEDMAGFRETTWYDRDPEGFVEHIRNGKIFQTLTEKTIHQRYVSIGST